MTEVSTKYWTFNQNNSGGLFVFDEDNGITHFVIIEAIDRDHAIQRAKSAGIYFDGCAVGRDCHCCGDRWSEPWSDDEEEFPSIYGRNVRDDGAYFSAFGGGYMPEGKEVCIHRIDGSYEWYGADREVRS